MSPEEHNPQASSGETTSVADYDVVLDGLVALLQEARRSSARSVNAIMTATYWEIGRRIVENDQHGHQRAGYGKQLVKRLARDLTRQFGRGFSVRSLERFRAFYLTWRIPSTPLSEFSNDAAVASTNSSTLLTEFDSPRKNRHINELAKNFPLPWSHYVYLLGVKNPLARSFYETEALRGGWTVRQLRRQIESQFYERTALSNKKASMLEKSTKPIPEDAVSVDESVKDPFVLEFLGLKDEYAESDLEEALIRHLESFLLELGNSFAFIGRQRRLRIDDEWYRVDLLFYHRRLRCLIVIDLKLGRFTHADAGQMHLYLNYAQEHWMEPGENPPVGITLCASKSDALVRYATEGLPNKMLVREYLTALPDEKLLADEISRTRQMLESRNNVERLK